MSWVILIIAGLFEMLGVLTISNYNQKKIPNLFFSCLQHLPVVLFACT